MSNNNSTGDRYNIYPLDSRDRRQTRNGLEPHQTNTKLTILKPKPKVTHTQMEAQSVDAKPATKRRLPFYGMSI